MDLLEQLDDPIGQIDNRTINPCAHLMGEDTIVIMDCRLKTGQNICNILLNNCCNNFLLSNIGTLKIIVSDDKCLLRIISKNTESDITINMVVFIDKAGKILLVKLLEKTRKSIKK